MESGLPANTSAPTVECQTSKIARSAVRASGLGDTIDGESNSEYIEVNSELDEKFHPDYSRRTEVRGSLE